MQNKNNFFNGSFIPTIIYNNVEIEKSIILSDLKDKSGIYLWTHKESGKIYIGSAFDLSYRISKYLSKGYLLNKKGSSYIYNALLDHGYSAFSLAILEYIDTLNLSKEEAKNLILKREQFYLDNMLPEFNILKVAGSLLGYIHSDETKAKLSETFSGENNPFYGKTHSEQTLIKISEVHKGKSLSDDTKAKMSFVQRSIDRTGENNPMFGKIGESNPFYGKTHSTETLTKMSKKVFVYSLDSVSNEKILFKSFNNITEAAKYFDCNKRTLFNYIDNNKLYKKQWILSYS